MVRTCYTTLVHQHLLSPYQSQLDLCFHSYLDFLHVKSFLLHEHLWMTQLPLQFGAFGSNVPIAQFTPPIEVHPHWSGSIKYIISKKEFFHICAWTWLLYKYCRSALVVGNFSLLAEFSWNILWIVKVGHQHKVQVSSKCYIPTSQCSGKHFW